MKKVILSLIFVLAIGTSFMNANNLTIKTDEFEKFNLLDESLVIKSFDLGVLFGCWESADLTLRYAEAYMESEGNPFSYEQQHNVWVSAYEICMGDQQVEVLDEIEIE